MDPKNQSFMNGVNVMSEYKPAKRRTIRNVIQAKISDWLESLPAELQLEVKNKIIVTGGSIVSLYTGNKINDFDIYFKDLETTKKVAEYYAGRAETELDTIVEVRVEEQMNIKGELETRVINYVPSSGVAGDTSVDSEADDRLEDAGVDVDVKPEQDEKYRLQFISANAITLSDKMQLITRFYGDPAEIHRSFDFAHCMGYYDTGTKELHVTVEALEAMLSRTLIYRGSLYPVASIFRMKKFVERGWRIGAGELFKIMYQISKIDLDDLETLIDQATGADLLYMMAFIERLKSAKESGIQITNDYVMELLDAIFND